MQTLKMDFQSQSTPPVVPVMQSDAQSRFIGISLYNGGVPYEAPEGASYTVQYRGPGANNMGWYDTITLSSGTRKAVIVDSTSKNVVTLELAEQALRVNGNVFVNLCVVTNAGYMLKTFPILCRVTGAAFPDTVAMQSFFYVTGITSEQWLAYVTACQDAQKRAEDAAAKFVTDPTLSLSGKAADAKATGDKISLNTAYITDSNLKLTGEPGFRTPSNNGNVTSNADWYTVMANIDDVTQPYGTIVNTNVVNHYGNEVPAYFFLDATKTTIPNSAVYKTYNDLYLPVEQIPENAKYICLNHSEKSKFELLTYNVKKESDDANELNPYVLAYDIKTKDYSRAGRNFFPLKLKKGDVIKVIIGKYVNNDDQYALSAVNSAKTSTTDYQSIKPLSSFKNLTSEPLMKLTTMKKDFTGFNIYIPDVNNDPETIKIYVRKNRVCEQNKIYIASNNATKEEKEKANIICDGVNDELDIQNAFDFLPANGTIILSSGDFTFDNSYKFDNDLNYHCVCAYPKYSKYQLHIKGQGNRGVVGGTTIHIKDTIINTGETSVFGGFIRNFYADTGIFQFNGLSISDMNIEFESGNKNFVGIDLSYTGHGVLHDLGLSCINKDLNFATFTEGGVGIRGYNGYSTSSQNMMERISAEGFYTAFQLGGEHIICNNLTARTNYIGFSFGDYYFTYGTFDHPITLINCADEHSCKLPQFIHSGLPNSDKPSKQEIDMISFNIEIDPQIFADYATETTPNSFCGRIEYTIGGIGENVTDYWKFWKEGSGHLFQTRNMAMAYVGTTATRKSYNAEFNQSYFDTDLNKMLWHIDGKWTDAFGNQVDS